MKKNLLIVFVLMAVCVSAIIGLQLYFSYQTYETEAKVFDRNVNEVLNEAVENAFESHRRDVVKQFKGWLADTTIVNISCAWNAKQNVTVFTIKEVEPPFTDKATISLSLEQFPEKLAHITPHAKAVLIKHMEDVVYNDLKSGSVYFYTQKLGERLAKAYDKKLISLMSLQQSYIEALLKRNITQPFSFNRVTKGADVFNTKKVNIAIRRPYKQKWLYASFTNTNAYLLKQLKWVLLGSLLLIIITLTCFWYTVKVLLSQQKLNALKDDFISNMTHEINTPLTSITITAQALKQFSHDPVAQQSYLDIILHQTEKLTALTDEILTGAKMEYAGITLNDMVDINTLIANAVNDYTKGNAIVKFEPLFKDVNIKGNAAHLARALNNIIDNAIKYSTDAAPEVLIKIVVSGKSIIISVADNGLGITDEFKQKVFEQFYRVPAGNTHNIKGYGMGLSYVQKVVKAHNGTIAIKDNVPTGSIFVITLPL